MLHEGAVKKKREHKGGEREWKSLGSCWIQKANRRRWCRYRNSVIWTFFPAIRTAECLQKKKNGKTGIVAWWKDGGQGRKNFPQSLCDSDRCESRMRSRRQRVLGAHRVPVSIFTLCDIEAFFLVCSMVIIQQLCWLCPNSSLLCVRAGSQRGASHQVFS